MKKYISILICIFVIMLLCVSNTFASSITNGLTITPTIQQINLKQNQDTASYTIQLTNDLSYSATIDVEAQDFTSLNKNGGINFINEGSKNNNVHGLENNIRTGSNQLILGPDQETNVTVNLVNLNNLAPGGHYTTIVFKVQSLFNSKGNHVAINQGVASLLFLSTYGNGTQDLSVQNKPVKSFNTSFPNTFNILFQNNGNTQSIPIGYVQIVNADNHVVSQGQLNVNSGIVLPQSNGLFNTVMHRTSNHVWFGGYKLKIFYTYSGKRSYSVYQTRFLYINSGIIYFVSLIILILIVYLLRRHLPSSIYKVKK